MASLSNHGTEVGRVELLTSALSYRSDGHILRNQGFGWKLYGTVKAEFTPEQAYTAKAERVRLSNEARPMYSAYKRELHTLAGLSLRWKLHAAIESMPDDYDGVWSEACDGYGDNCHADIDEVRHLCILYGAAIVESERLALIKNGLVVAPAE